MWLSAQPYQQPQRLQGYLGGAQELELFILFEQVGKGFEKIIQRLKTSFRIAENTRTIDIVLHYCALFALIPITNHSEGLCDKFEEAESFKRSEH